MAVVVTNRDADGLRMSQAVVGFNRPIVPSILFDLTVELSSIRWFQRVASTFYNASQPNRGTTRNGFRHGIQHSIPHAVTKADSPFIMLGVRWNAKHYGDVTMDRSAERHFCDGCPDRRP
jgi:hypothetical protein